eukprot:334656-Amphidinium_carterae.1
MACVCSGLFWLRHLWTTPVHRPLGAAANGVLSRSQKLGQCIAWICQSSKGNQEVELIRGSICGTLCHDRYVMQPGYP